MFAFVVDCALFWWNHVEINYWARPQLEKVKQILHVFPNYWISHQNQQICKSSASFYASPPFSNLYRSWLFPTAKIGRFPQLFQDTGAAFNGSDTCECVNVCMFCFINTTIAVLKLLVQLLLSLYTCMYIYIYTES